VTGLPPPIIASTKMGWKRYTTVLAQVHGDPLFRNREIRKLDGGWDYNAPEEKSGRIGSLSGTIHCLRWLREFGLSKSLQMVRFTRPKQSWLTHLRNGSKKIS